MGPANVSIAAFLQDAGLTEDEVGARQRCLGWEPADAAALAAVHADLAGRQGPLVEGFYEQLHSVPALAPLLPRGEGLARLKAAQADYFRSLTRPDEGPGYMQSRLEIGLAHHRIGLEPKWYMAAYSRYLCTLLPQVWEAAGGDWARFAPAFRALLKRVFLDITLAVDAYHQADRRHLAGLRACAETLIEHTPTGLMVLDSRLRVLSANTALDGLLGGGADRPGERRLERLLPGAATAARAVLDDAASHQVRLAVTDTDGAERCLRVTATPLPPAAADLPEWRDARVLLTVEDISQHERGMALIRRLSRTVEQSDDLVVITDTDGTIEYVNPAFERATGFSSAEAVGHKANLVRSGLHDDAFYRRVWRTLRRGEVVRETFINRRRGGELFYEEKTITPVTDENGRITHFVSTGKDITERLRTERRLYALIHNDPLTGLPNRSDFMERAGEAVARARRHGRHVALMLVDLNKFKDINNSFGHQAGDQLLRAVGEALADELRPGDTVAHFGAGEFGVLLEDVAGVDDIAPLARKLLAVFDRRHTLTGQEVRVTANMGVSVYPNNGEDVSTLLRNADTAASRAKARGRQLYQFYESDMNTQAYKRVTLEASLHRALEQREFVLHYQPQFSLDDGTVVGVEALIRWRHPDLGLVAPGDFIPLLEDTGLIIPVGRWVLTEACRQMMTWRRRDNRMLRLSVNISARQFSDPGLADNVVQALCDTGMPASMLELEITESVIMQNVALAMDMLQALHGTGVRLAIDDFGTGYSSLSYLKRFPLDTLKIDRSFVADLPANRDAAAIARAVITLGRALNLEVVAEGIETEEQRRFLRAEGCTLGQGFLCGRPQAALDGVISTC